MRRSPARLTQPWLKSSSFDLVFILLPSFVSVLIAMQLSRLWPSRDSIPLWVWLVFILGIDVSHVYSTLFRTYFNSNEVQENKALLTLIPLGVWLMGVGLYWADPLFFWRALTYAAVYHFIRQQYGFLRLYTRGAPGSMIDQWLAKLTIYMATVYPILYWHTHQPRNFHWFVDGDFVVGLPLWVSWLAGWFYFALVVSYAVNEMKNLIRDRRFNLPKNVILLGTMLSWYLGIVHFNGDMIFTITNVVSHGIPYMALVWVYGDRQKDRADSPLILNRFSYRLFFSKASVPLFLGVLLLFGYLEEGLWAGFVWREHLHAFGFLSELPHVTARDTLTWLVPLLTLPQASHYVLDGFIWKLKDSEANWQKVLFSGRFGIQSSEAVSPGASPE